MRASSYALFLFSLLVLYAISTPVEEQSGLKSFLDGPTSVGHVLPGSIAESIKQALGTGSLRHDADQDLEKRGRSKGASRARTKKPARKRPQKKKKKASKKTQKKKKKPTSTRKKPSATKSKKPKKKTTKKPKKPAAACEYVPKGTKGKNGKVVPRAGQPAGASCPPAKVKKTPNYKVAEKAAMKAGHKLELGHTYLLRFKSNPGLVNHQALIIGTVKHRTNPADGALDFQASSSELVKPMAVPRTKIQAAKQKCTQLHGAKCKHRGIEKVYQCKAAQKKWGKEAEFIFKGEANPEFVSSSKFIQTGKHLLEKDTTYDILYNNCGTHARKLENTVQLKKGQEPLVEIEIDEFDNLSLNDSD